MDGGSAEKVRSWFITLFFSLFDDHEDEDEKADDVSSDIDGGLLICGELFPAARSS